MAIIYKCDSCGKNTDEITKNKEEYGVEFCNDCRKTYTKEQERAIKEARESLEDVLNKISRKYGVSVDKKSLIESVKNALD